MADEDSAKMVTCTAPVNIAVIKYWGKRDEHLILPINDSISATLSSQQMHAKTTVSASSKFTSDRLWLNGIEETTENPRIVNCLKAVRERARKCGNVSDEMLSWNIHICSENNFPTAAGLASSAAGYACLVYALCQLYNVEGDISELARQGSGSACRSVYGGFVRWYSGTRDDGTDSIARQVQPAKHWPNIRVLILVANDARKKVASSKGMKLSVQTSDLIQYRAEKCVPERCISMEDAIAKQDFKTFAEITMKDSNQLHAVCLDTYPPCTYMNSTSHSVADLVHQVNAAAGEPLACYTFDAGPNACIFLMEENVNLFAHLFKHFFPPKNVEQDFFRGEELDMSSEDPRVKELLSRVNVPFQAGALRYIIATRVGEGPEVLKDPADQLLNTQGLPK